MTDYTADQDERTKTRFAICDALRDPASTIGTAVTYSPPHMLMIGNLACDDPALSTVAIDDVGRLWKERHYDGKSELICILDLRHLGDMNHA